MSMFDWDMSSAFLTANPNPSARDSVAENVQGAGSSWGVLEQQ